MTSRTESPVWQVMYVCRSSLNVLFRDSHLRSIRPTSGIEQVAGWGGNKAPNRKMPSITVGRNGNMHKLLGGNVSAAD